MGVLNFLKDERFSLFFSFVLGIGLICMFRPICSGEKDFDKYVYRMGSKCYEFKSEIVECPTSGTIEAFRECSSVTNYEPFRDDFSRRGSPIKRCE
jgi:hypothetical protein